MGMYDVVNIPCPNCGNRIQVQSKAGPCDLESYFIYSEPVAPPKVLADLDGLGFECSQCGVVVRVRVQVVVSIFTERPDEEGG